MRSMFRHQGPLNTKVGDPSNQVHVGQGVRLIVVRGADEARSSAIGQRSLGTPAT
jgi:hypothetical protein